MPFVPASNVVSPACLDPEARSSGGSGLERLVAQIPRDQALGLRLCALAHAAVAQHMFMTAGARGGVSTPEGPTDLSGSQAARLLAAAKSAHPGARS